MNLQVTFNGSVYTLTYNSQSGYYEIELEAPEIRWNSRSRTRIY